MAMSMSGRTNSFAKRCRWCRAGCPRGSAGFSLFELLLAIGLLAMSCVILFGVQAGSVDQAAEARFYAQASMLAQQKMSEYRLRDFADLRSDSGDCGPDYPGMFWEGRVRELGAGESGLTGSEGWLKQVELTLHEAGPSPHRYTVRTVLFKKIEATR